MINPSPFTSRVKPWLPLTLLAGLASIWGTAFLFTRMALEEVPFEWLVFSRIAVAALAMNAFRILAGHALPRDAGWWARFLPLAVTGTLLPFLMISWAQEELSSGLAGILMSIVPLASVGIAHFAVPGERLTNRMGLGVGLGLAGVIVLLGPESLRGFGASDTLARQAAALLGAVAYAVNTVLARRLPKLEPSVYASGVLLVASALAAPLALASPMPEAPSSSALFSVLWLGLLPTGIATWMHFRLVTLAGAGFTSLANYAVPVVAVAAGAAFYGEQFGSSALAGLGLVLAGIALARRTNSRPAKRPVRFGPERLGSTP